MVLQISGRECMGRAGYNGGASTEGQQILWGLLAPAFGADPGFDAHGPKFVAHDTDLRDLLYVQRPGAMRAGDFFGSVVGEFAQAPLMRAYRGDAGVLREDPVVDDLAGVQVSLGGAFHERLRVDLLAPVYATSLGPDGRQGPAMGDVRLSAMGVLLAPERLARGGGGLGVGLVAFADLPSGDAGRFLGRGAAGGGARLALTWELDRVTFSADGGVEGAPALELDNLPGGPAVTGGAGVGVLVGQQASVNLEILSRSPLTSSAVGGTGFASEAALSLRGAGQSGAGWTLGGALGLTEGAGVAAFRAFLGVGFGRHGEPPTPDADVEGTLAVIDGCPLQSEVVNGWKDDDGCPDELGALSIDVRFRGQNWPAQVELTGPDAPPRVESIGREGLVLDAVPGSVWRASARTSDCLAGTGEATVAEGGSRLLVALEPVLDALVEVTVTGPNGEPMPESSAVWRGEAPHCVPAGTVSITGGRSVQQVGPGAHALTVTAPGYTSAELQVAAASGQKVAVQAVLASARVKVEARRITITEKVYFETGNARIKPESFGLLDEIATTILTATSVGRVEVGGHTDNQGSDTYNQRLSQQRAESVRDYLVGKGVARDQLVPVGYGETRPIDTNRTDGGRETNRRVEFLLLDAPPEEAP
jgi:outer membrane protein OmpA-like peptidoglycan-associated protein